MKVVTLVLGTLAWVAGCVMLTISFQLVSKANPQEDISPVLGRPTHYPPTVHLYKIAASVLLLLSFYFWAEVIGGYATVGFILAWAPTAVLTHRHNRPIRQRPLGPGPQP